MLNLSDKVDNLIQAVSINQLLVEYFLKMALTIVPFKKIGYKPHFIFYLGFQNRLSVRFRLYFASLRLKLDNKIR